MKDRILPPESLLTRRRFCQAAGVGVVTIALPACFGGAQRVGVGGIDDTDAGPPPNADLAAGGPDLGPPDLANTRLRPDLQPAPDPNACPGGIYNTKRAPGMFAVNTATYFSSQDAFVCRDGSGLFTLSSLCTHEGCTVTYRASGTYFYCPCHGAKFAYLGNPTYGPTNIPLDHYAMCIHDDGNIGFDINTVVSKSVRLVA